MDRRHPLSGTLAELYRQPATSYLSLSGLDQGDAIYHMIVLVGLRWSRAGCPSWRRPCGGSWTGSPPTSAGGPPSPCCCARPAAPTRPASSSSRWPPATSPGCPVTTSTSTTWSRWRSPATPWRTGLGAARLHQLLGPYADHNVLVARLPLGTLGSASHYLGLLAATTGRRDDAAAHFRAAIGAHQRMGAAPLLERSRRMLQRL